MANVPSSTGSVYNAAVNRPSIARLCAVAAVCTLALVPSACVSHTHSVGLGATGSGSTEVRQYYVLFGLFAANDVDAQRLAGGLTSYAITTEYAFVDLLLQPLLLPFTMTSRTVTVRT